MKKIIQVYLLKFYSLLERSGILSVPLIRSIFTKLYELYKLVIEAGEVESLENYVRPGEVIVDVGANVGFFTKRFAKWVSDGGSVLAIEPESVNFNELTKNIENSGIAGLVKTFQGVAADESGSLILAINPNHPGDHKIGEEGIEVKAYTIDELTQTEEERKVCLMKIDVQGAEERVLNGAKKMIEKDHPAIFIEVDDIALQKMGSSSQKIIDWLLKYNYKITRLEKGKAAQEITIDEALKLSSNGQYTDLLFI